MTTIKEKLQRMRKSIKNIFTGRGYKLLYLNSSKPGVFYGNTNVNKLKKSKGLVKY